MDNTIFFPLRGNIEFFNQTSNQPLLISRIKNSILMFDDLIFEAGGFTFSCGERAIMTTNIPPQSVQLMKFKIPKKPMTNFFANAINERTGKAFNLIPYQKAKNYFVSFQPIIEELGLLKEKFINFKSVGLTKKGKELIKTKVESDKQYLKLIEGNSFFKKGILENLHHSLLRSMLIKSPMLVDSLHTQILSHMSSNTVKIADIRLQVLTKINSLLRFELPDFSSLTMDELLKYRKDKLFIRFRSKLLEINNVLLNKKPQEFDESIIQSLFVTELLKEVRELAPSGSDILINGAIGAIPYGIGGVIGGIKDSIGYLNFKNSWLAFVMTNKE